MVEFRLTTPVVFIIFNRPDVTERVFAEIAKAKPAKLFIVADGPRRNRPGEIEKVSATREIVKHVDWPCEVFKNFSETNLGCKHRVSTGLDWAFEHIDEAIILEDDCLPHPTFFQFCQELLERYRNDPRFALISGTSLSVSSDMEDSYYFSRYPHIWGWATWRRVWKKYDVRMEGLSRLKRDANFKKSFASKAEWKFWLKNFHAVNSGKVDTWDAQVVFLTFVEGMLSIFPKKNLISNIGFGEAATHTKSKNSILSNIQTLGISFPLQHPMFVLRDMRAEYDRKKIEGIGRNYFWGVAIRLFNLLGMK